ncbi:MAG: carbohydrate kinase family protein [Candidatus Pacebacteria bacterium]|nr:carbohydrate kinase family protein [Candidatus Paceibacterota bacterium]
MFDVITFGSATNDIFLKLPEDKNIKNTENGIRDFFCLALGEKILVEDMEVFSGGGGTNVACGLSALGLKTAYLGKVGNDSAGRLVINDLERYSVSVQLLKKDKSLPTAVSFILSSGHDRTILVFRGACHFLNKEEIFRDSPWRKGTVPEAKWLYLAPLYEKTAEFFSDLVGFAKSNNIKVAVNPSIYQIKRENAKFLETLAKADIIFLNKEEASIIANSPNSSAEETAKIIHKICPGIIAITQGDNGAVVFDGERFFKASVYKVAAVDKTGAGDSFAAGFLAGLFKANDIEYAIRLAMVNSSGCISQRGAKNGLLTQSELKLLPNTDIIQERAF